MLLRALQTATTQAITLAYQGIGMCAILDRYEDTVKDSAGGDLLDMLEDPEDDDGD